MKKAFVLALLLFSVCCSFAQSKRDLKQAEIKKIILAESKEGGKYDFFTPIAGHEYDGIQIKPGIYDTKLGLALIKWRQVNRDLGVRKLEDAYLIFSEYKGRAINDRVLSRKVCK